LKQKLQEEKFMIKIELPESISYFRLRREYLKRIAKYVRFDAKDISTEADSSCKGKTADTARELKDKFRNLYHFLFVENTEKVRTENLRWLLAGPDVPPESFGGIGGYKTMQESLKTIIGQCKIENDKDKTTVREVCKIIFKYDEFVKGQEDAYWLLRALGVRVCPYCNRIYTTTLPTKEELEEEERGEEFATTRATYDHFYCQDQYPYLSLSLFNLIPSCNICNSNKGSHGDEIIYPYDEGFGKNVVFRLIPDLKKEEPDGNVLHFLTGESDKFHVRLMGKDRTTLLEDSRLEDRLSDIGEEDYRKRIVGSIEMFRLEKLYNELKPEIMDILRNRYYFNEEYIRSVIPLIKESKKSKDEGGISDEQAWQLAMDMLFRTRLRPEEWKERPLAKLTADIIEYIDALNENKNYSEEASAIFFSEE